jgi:quaternary ammonium compound-resistance protein SugE
MAWVVLFIAGLLEAVWAVALSKTDGFTRPGPTAVFLIAIAASMLGLAYAMRTLPVGTAYAVWVGVGAALTVAFGMVTGAESVGVMKLVLLAGLIGCIAGLKFAH